ncbi:FYVE zinc finger-domain-containing protein [Crucibulum laeve]|uniref:FYVE zinc finger-domain-containing protein n=1 Tax=Crucibulum laeve TaxID=68775 RepID=A0A5C3MBV8_9AGAR|nr:FYVE zinc finger-domain-containing protein [Crucibulum laeve]
MSALSIALAAFHGDLPIASTSTAPISPPPSAPVSRPASPSPSLPALSCSTPSSSASSLLDVPAASLQINTGDRPNEHLAVLLPKHLWKPDSLASQCDNFYCRVAFSMFERRHHCRKCGGVFCSACTSRNTLLLDTSNLSFIHPPRNMPLASFESPSSPIVPSRVCDDCYDQIYGCPTTPRTPDLVRPSMKRALSHPISMLKSPLSASSSSSGESSLSSSLVATPPSDSALPVPHITRKARSLRATPSISSINTQTSSQSTPSPRRLTVRTSQLPLPLDLERSYGELDAYPLKRSSILCKATGGGRWEPKQSPVLVGYRPPVPGGKALYELDMEREEQEERSRRENPIVRDGAFQYRFQKRDVEQIEMARSPFNISTF